MPIYNPGSVTSNLTVLKNGSSIGTRPTLNLIEGSQVALDVSDDAGNARINTTISSSAAGSSLGGTLYSGVISSFGEGSMAADVYYSTAGNLSAAGVWPVANKGIYIPVQVLVSCTVYQLGWLNGATVGTNTVDVGIYSEAGTRLISTTPTLTSGASALQTVNIADTVLTPDTYYLAMAMNGTTDTVFRSAAGFIQGVTTGVGEQTGLTSGTLPATFSLSALASSFFPAVAAAFESAVF